MTDKSKMSNESNFQLNLDGSSEVIGIQVQNSQISQISARIWDGSSHVVIWKHNIGNVAVGCGNSMPTA